MRRPSYVAVVTVVANLVRFSSDGIPERAGPRRRAPRLCPTCAQPLFDTKQPRSDRVMCKGPDRHVFRRVDGQLEPVETPS